MAFMPSEFNPSESLVVLTFFEKEKEK